MVKVTVKVPKSINKNIQKKLEKAIDDPKLLQKAFSPLLKEIKSGKNPKTGRPYKSLKDSTIARRKVLAKINKTSSRYSPRKSNLTFSGQLLDSIRSVYEKVGKKSFITIEPTGTHKGYKLVRGGRSKDVDNIEIAKGLDDQGFKILTFSKKNINKIKENLKKLLTKKVKKLFK